MPETRHQRRAGRHGHAVHEIAPRDRTPHAERAVMRWIMRGVMHGVMRGIAFVVRSHGPSLPRGPRAVQIGRHFHGLR